MVKVKYDLCTELYAVNRRDFSEVDQADLADMERAIFIVETRLARLEKEYSTKLADLNNKFNKAVEILQSHNINILELV